MLRITLITIFTCSVFILSGCSGGSDGNDNSSSVDQSNMNNENSMSGPFSGAPDGDLASIENLAATPGVGNSVHDNIFNNPDLTNFREAIDAAGLASTLDNEEQPFTVFAPVNSAFTVFALSNLGVDLTPIVNNHISPGLRSISNLSNVESEIS